MDVGTLCGCVGRYVWGCEACVDSSISRKRLKIFTSRFHHWIQHENVLENDVSYDPFSSFKKNPRWRPKLANF